MEVFENFWFFIGALKIFILFLGTIPLKIFILFLGDYVLSVRNDDRVTHVIIRCRNGRFDIGEKGKT